MYRIHYYDTELMTWDVYVTESRNDFFFTRELLRDIGLKIIIDTEEK